MFIINRLKELRVARNMNMRELAEQLSMPYTTYVNYEKGAREPNSETLIMLANFFSVSVDYLLGQSNDKLEERLLDIVNTIDSDIKEHLKVLFNAAKRRVYMCIENDDEKLALISKDVINVLANNNLTVTEAECVLEKAQRGIRNSSKVRFLDW